jgi:cell wall-associated NlpC family hydrolase
MKKYVLFLLLSFLFQGRPGVLLAKSADSDLESEITGLRIAECASRYLKTGYQFGGHSKEGLDCSGLVSLVWQDLNLGQLPPQTSALWKLGREVEPEEIQAGDLVFFENTYRRGISHVGIYTEDKKMIHAAGKRRGLMESKITDPYYVQRIIGVRRLY